MPGLRRDGRWICVSSSGGSNGTLARLLSCQLHDACCSGFKKGVLPFTIVMRGHCSKRHPKGKAESFRMQDFKIPILLLNLASAGPLLNWEKIFISPCPVCPSEDAWIPWLSRLSAGPAHNSLPSACLPVQYQTVYVHIPRCLGL